MLDVKKKKLMKYSPTPRCVPWRNLHVCTHTSAVCDCAEQTRDHRRMDLVIHYLGRRYIVEMKIWRGERYNSEGEKQISRYLDYFGLTTGYMLSFSFNRDKKPGVYPIHLGDKLLYEGVV